MGLGISDFGRSEVFVIGKNPSGRLFSLLFGIGLKPLSVEDVVFVTVLVGGFTLVCPGAFTQGLGLPSEGWLPRAGVNACCRRYCERGSGDSGYTKGTLA